MDREAMARIIDPDPDVWVQLDPDPPALVRDRIARRKAGAYAKADQILALDAARSYESERVKGLVEAAQRACDLLAERTYGSPARSPGHNARLTLEDALSAIPGEAVSAGGGD